MALEFRGYLVAAVTIRYRSSRREIWAFYWWCWRQKKGLWTLQALIAAFAFLIAFRSLSTPELHFPLLAIGIAAGTAVLSVAWMPLFPLLMFKPQERTLTVDEVGLHTQIGRRSGDRSWSQVMTIVEVSDLVVIVGTNLNGFVVPSRAFPSPDERSKFLSLVRQLHGEHGGVNVGLGYDASRTITRPQGRP